MAAEVTVSGSSAAFDVVIVGAGFSGLYALLRLREAGFKVCVFEAGDGVGGTWYWNRYPNARVDFESFEYSYSFSEDLQQEWHWEERYAGQPELLRYLNHVADRFHLRRDIRLSTRVTSVEFVEADAHWVVRTDRGDCVRATHCVMATGLLSQPKTPDFPGLSAFRGESYLTALWPQSEVDFTGKRVGVIGTGSSGVQVIPPLARQAAHLTVFQRTRPFVVPAHNAPMTPHYEQRLKARYAELRRAEFLSETGIGLLLGDVESLPLPRRISALEVSPQERLAEYERRWASGSLCFLNAFQDLAFNVQANETLAEFLRAKIRAAVRDPAMAAKLVPHGYPVFSRRLSVCDGYYETYDRDNVTLVDLFATPIETFTPRGIRAGVVEHALDAVVFATGFDAQTGTLARIDIRGRAGLTLAAAWADGAATHLGLMTAGFPNLFYLCGPGAPSAVYPPILLGEYQTQWLARTLGWLCDRGRRSIEPRLAAQEAWVRHSREVADQTVFPLTNSWYMGANIEGKPTMMLSYIGGYTAYRARVDATESGNYAEFLLDG